MRENSIEEDIRNTEHFVNSIINDKSYDEKGWHGYDNAEIVELAIMLEHILSDYKRVLKENEELKENCNIDYKRECEVLALQLHLLREEAKTTEKDYNMLKEYYKEQNEVNAKFIPVQKVKDKIETLEKLQKEFHNNEELRIKIIAYKELLESNE